MKLYFVRHATASGKAAWSEDDDLRPLTRAGRQRFRLAASSLISAGVLHPDLIITSPLVRAEQTAQLLGKELGGSIPVVKDARLGHGFDFDALEAILAENRDARSLAIVGHNPSFSGVLSQVVGGAEMDMRKGAVALVELAAIEPPVGKLMWLAPPSVFPGCP